MSLFLNLLVLRMGLFPLSVASLFLKRMLCFEERLATKSAIQGTLFLAHALRSQVSLRFRAPFFHQS